jgi:ribosomal RNA-processing protein 12
LLSLPPLPHLTSQIFSLLAHLLSPPPADFAGPKPSVLTNLPTIIDSLLSSPPELTSKLSDMPGYLSALSSYLPRAFTLIFNNMLLVPTASFDVLKAASDAIGSQGLVRYCVSDEMIVAAVNYHRQGSDQPGARKKQKTPFLTKVISSVSEALNSHALRMPYLFPILTALVSRLRLRVTAGGSAEVDPLGNGKTAAEELLMEIVREVGDLRMQKGFEAKDKVDEVVGMTIEVIGVEGVLKALPLNIEPDA